MVRRSERLGAEVRKRGDALANRGTVANQQEMHPPARAPVVEPSLERHLFANMLAQVFDISRRHAVKFKQIGSVYRVSPTLRSCTYRRSTLGCFPMAAQLNGLDYAIIALVGFGALYGLGRGALRMATSILSLALGLYAASIWYQRVGAYVEKLFKTSPTVSGAIGYVVVFILVFVAIEFAGRRVIMLVNLVNLGCIDR